MLRTEQNEALTRTGPGTLMGELLRQLWLPVLIESELSSHGPPLRMRVLGEDLVAFKSPDGSVGLVSAYCAHRCAPLWFARNEADGLRCTYHGWMYDKEGRCLEMPNEPPAQRFEAKVRLDAYPALVKAGIVWAYMGSGEPPALPGFHWIDLPPSQLHVARWLHESNWVQGMEGEIDNSHVPFLHSVLDISDDTTLLDGEEVGVFEPRESTFAVPYPTLMVRRTPSGLLVGSRRELTDGGFHWRVTRWWPPSWSMIGNPHPPFNGRAWIPIDDSHTMVFSYTFHPERPLNDQERAYLDSGVSFPPATEFGRYELADGYCVDIPVPVQKLGNDYLVDRERQRVGASYTGIRGMNPQDRSVQDAMRPVLPGTRIVDRSKERLGSADVGIIAARRRLLQLANEYAEHGTRPLVGTDPRAYRGRSLDVVAPVGDFDQLIERYRDEIGESVLE